LAAIHQMKNVVERFSCEGRKVIGSETKSNRDSFAYVFPRYASTPSSDWFAGCDWLDWLLSFAFGFTTLSWKPLYRSFSLSRKIKKKFQIHLRGKVKNCDRKEIKKTLLQVLGLCVFPNFRYSSKCFAKIYRGQYGATMLTCCVLCGTTIWRPENSVNILNLLWLSRRLIFWTQQTNVYLSTFPNTLTSKKAQNRDKF